MVTRFECFIDLIVWTGKSVLIFELNNYYPPKYLNTLKFDLVLPSCVDVSGFHVHLRTFEDWLFVPCFCWVDALLICGPFSLPPSHTLSHFTDINMLHLVHFNLCCWFVRLRERVFVYILTPSFAWTPTSLLQLWPGQSFGETVVSWTKDIIQVHNTLLCMRCGAWIGICYLGGNSSWLLSNQGYRDCLLNDVVVNVPSVKVKWCLSGLAELKVNSDESRF